MTKQENLAALKRIRGEVIDKIYKERWEEVWFFPEYRGVKGFLGTDPIFFVSINPSFGAFPDGPCISYYRSLRRQGFGNAHLTDFFKVKCKNQNFKKLLRNESLVHESRQILEEEIEALSPKLIVGVGTSYKVFYSQILTGFDIPLDYIPHYAPRFNDTEKRNSLEGGCERFAKFMKV